VNGIAGLAVVQIHSKLANLMGPWRLVAGSGPILVGSFPELP
jgi:hypothetical protein